MRRLMFATMGLVWFGIAAVAALKEGSASGTLGAGLTLVVLLVVAHRHFGSHIRLDADGIWVIRLGERRGLRWPEVVGYEEAPGAWVILGRDGQRLALPNSALLDYYERAWEIQRALDIRIGPDGERPATLVPSDPVLAQIQNYYGQMPSVEMEPGIVYRSGHREDLRQLARGTTIFSASAILGGFLVLAFRARLPFLDGFSLALLAAMLPLTAHRLFQGIQLARRVDDRLVMKEGVLHRIRAGEVRPLPPPQSKPGSRLYGQPTTRYGKGPFAYEVSPQFLEPDV